MLESDTVHDGLISLIFQMARGIMNAFPAVPVLQFGTSRKEMGNEWKIMALQILKASGL